MLVYQQMINVSEMNWWHWLRCICVRDEGVQSKLRLKRHYKLTKWGFTMIGIIILEYIRFNLCKCDSANDVHVVIKIEACFHMNVMQLISRFYLKQWCCILQSVIICVISQEFTIRDNNKLIIMIHCSSAQLFCDLLKQCSD